jgi:hypothetical protein
VLAAVRLSSAVTYIREDDYTYNLAPQALLQTAEMTAGILVFTIPATPKLLAYVMQQAGASIDKLVGSRRGGNSDGGGSGPFLSNRKKSHPSFEQPIEEQRLVAKLGKLRSARSKDSFPNGHADKLPSSHRGHAAETESGILRTTHLTAAHSFVSDHRNESCNRQHPWIEDSPGI